MRRKKIEEAAFAQDVLSQMRKERLLLLAGSYKEFARTLAYLPTKEDAKERTAIVETKERNEYQTVFMHQMRSFADRFAQVAEEKTQIHSLCEKQFKNAVADLRAYGVLLRQGYVYRENNIEHYFFELKVQNKARITLNDVAGILSVVFKKEFVCVTRECLLADRQYHTYQFEEKPGLHMMTGFARAVKEGGTISGDNVALVERKDHSTFLLMSDGVGSGTVANRESSVALDMIESLLNSENTLEQSVFLTGSAFLLSETEMHFPSLDACELRLDQRVCEFVKAGAVSSFLKRGQDVEIIRGGGTPLGDFTEENILVLRKALEDDSYIIMITDGVLQNIDSNEPEQILKNFIRLLTITNPKEIANQILQFAILQSGGKVHDDMLVYVAGVWENMV